MKILCELFGHSVSQVSLLIGEIKANEFNRGRGENIFKCRRKDCDWTLDLNDDKSLDDYLEEQKKRKPYYKFLWNFIRGKK